MKWLNMYGIEKIFPGRADFQIKLAMIIMIPLEGGRIVRLKMSELFRISSNLR